MNILSIDPGTRHFGFSISYVHGNKIHLSFANTVDLTRGKGEKALKKEHGKGFWTQIIFEAIWGDLSINRVNGKLLGSGKWYRGLLDAVVIEKTDFCIELVYGLVGAMKQRDDTLQIYIVDPRSVGRKYFSGLRGQVKKDATREFLRDQQDWVEGIGCLFDDQNKEKDSLLEHQRDSMLNLIYFLKHPKLFNTDALLASSSDSDSNEPDDGDGDTGTQESGTHFVLC